LGVVVVLGVVAAAGDAVSATDPLVAAPFAVELVVDADAPAMPAAAPPVATAPATIVAPSSFEIFTGEPPVRCGLAGVPSCPRGLRPPAGIRRRSLRAADVALDGG
jgi:hypothetical protein